MGGKPGSGEVVAAVRYCGAGIAPKNIGYVDGFFGAHGVQPRLRAEKGAGRIAMLSASNSSEPCRRCIGPGESVSLPSSSTGAFV